MSKAHYYDIIKRPIITEKAQNISVLGKNVFEVAIHATKKDIKSAIESIFNVKVENINSLIVKGKKKRFRGRLGKRSDYKKAVITLQNGQSIDLEAGI